MNITKLPNRLVSRLLYKTQLIAALGSLTLTLLVLAACAPAGSPTTPTVGHTSNPPTKTLTPTGPTPLSTSERSSQFEARTIIPLTIITNKDAKMTKTPPTPPPPEGSTENQLVLSAKEDLSKRLGIQMGEIMLLSMEEVTWRDGSLGCPKPGMQYTQALVNGTLIVLSVDGRQYRYHSGRGGTPFLCENKPDPPLPPGLGND